ncbi:MAG: hypothetical protein GF317_13650 [Candidatus Lokiarchaeota archaeon]|nr:hypothetical protein [Candidatus Lokiarchaeota archaeon]
MNLTVIILACYAVFLYLSAAFFVYRGIDENKELFIGDGVLFLIFAAILTIEAAKNVAGG